MTSLRELQQACYRAFVLGDSNSLLPAVRSSEIPARTRVAVYQNNARETFRKSLAASFPVIEQLVGAECFAGLALKYMREHPSRSGDLEKFGVAFPDFVHTLYEASQFAYLTDVARLEWALEEVHLEPDEAILRLSELSTVTPDDHPKLVFQVRKAVRLVRSPYPILSIWRANQPEHDADVDLRQGGECVAVLRRGDDLELHPLDPDTFELASALAGGASLQDAGERLVGGAESGEDPAAPKLAAALHSVMGLGLLSAWSLKVSPAPSR